MRGGVVVRILGIAPSAAGFGYAVTEGPQLLLRHGHHRTKVSSREMATLLGKVIAKYRPLFLAFEQERVVKLKARGRLLTKAVHEACNTHGVMLLPVTTKQLAALTKQTHPARRGIAEAMAERFPELQESVPPPRKAWLAESLRLSYFLALASAIAAWESFRAPKQ